LGPRNNFVGNLLTVRYVCLTRFIAPFIKRPIDKNAFIFRLNAFLQITTHLPPPPPLLPAILLALLCLGTRPPPTEAVRGGAPVVVADDDDETMEYAPQYVSEPERKKQSGKVIPLSRQFACMLGIRIIFTGTVGKSGAERDSSFIMSSTPC